MLMLMWLLQQQESKNIDTALPVRIPCSGVVQKGQLGGVPKVNLLAPPS